MIQKLLEEIPRRNTAIAVAGALLLAGSLSALAQDTNAPEVIKPTVVTGSYIPTAETVGPAAVQTLSTEAIDQSGTADTLMTLKKLVPSFTGAGNYLGNVNNNVNIGAGFNAYTGESYAQLRNLPTLILLDGQRVVTTALSGGQAVDLNSIPLAMIERVEVLKDGASAIYGSDAIGGVINIITKKNWNGFEIGGRYGFPTTEPINHGLQTMAWLDAGISTENTRFTAGAQIFNQNALQSKDRLIGSQSIGQLASQNVVPSTYFSPSYPGKVQVRAAYNPNNLIIDLNPKSDNYGFPTNPFSPAQSYILASSPFAIGAPGYNPNARPINFGIPFGVGHFKYTNSLVTLPDGTHPVLTLNSHNPVADYNLAAQGRGLGTPYIPFSTTPVGQQLDALGQGEASGWPALNTTTYGTTSILDQDRRQFWANFEHDLYEDKLTVYSRFMFSDNYAEGELAPNPIIALYNPAAGYQIAVPASNPYNPFGIDLGLNGATDPRVRSRTVDFGNRQFVTFSDFYQWVGGLKGNITPDYSYDMSFNYGRDRQEQQTRNAVNGAGLNTALIPIGATNAAGLPLSALTDAAGNNLPVYNIFAAGLTPGTGGNAPETIDQLRTTLFTWGQSELWSAQGIFNARPIELPAGKLNVAFGAQFIHEQLQIQVDGLFKLGLVPGLNPTSPFLGGSRETTAGFVEVSVPIFGKDQDIPGLYNLELDVAGRYQTFDPGGDKAVPKVALLWRPIDEQITLRGSYGQGFIAPPIWQLFGPDFVSNPGITINGANGQVTEATRANPNLQPSDSEQFGAGVVFSPKAVPGLTLSVDYYNVKENHLAIADVQTAANSLNALGSASPYAHGFTFVDGTTLSSPAPNQVTIDNWGNLILPYAPAAKLKTDGFDLSGNYVLPSTLIDEKYGKVTLGAVANLIMSYRVSTSPAKPYFDYVGTFTAVQGLIPDYNITASLTYQLGGFTAVAMAHYLPGISDPGGLFPEYGLTEQGFTINNTDKPFQVPDYYTIDLQLSYELGKGKIENRRWWDGTKFTVGVNNIADMTPRLIASETALEDNTDKNNYDILGRFVYFELSKKF